MLTRWFFRKGGGDPSTRGRFTVLARVARMQPRDVDPLGGVERPGEPFEAVWRGNVRRRVLVAVGLLAIWAVVVQAQLVNLQIRRHEELSNKSQAAQQNRIETEGLRGDILDRHGRILAYSVAAQSIIAAPQNVKDPRATADALCDALRDCTAKDRVDLARKLAARGQYAPIRSARSLSPDQTARVQELGLAGIELTAETRRYYPRGDLGAHIIGFVGAEGKGQAGIEFSQDTLVRGRGGVAFASYDARDHRLATRVELAPEPGASVELTIDLRLQYIVERELQAAVDANRARGGSVVVMDPETGEILALASYPTFNPNIAGRFTNDDRRNRAVQDVYEPGSTFKIVTAAAALEEGVFAPQDLIDCNPGYITFPGRKPITEASNHNYGVLTFEDMLVKSSNVCAIKAGMAIGPERLGRYVQRFGFGQTLAPDFVGESRGLWSPPGDASGLASVSMGYQISVTPLQMIAAASAVANGGVLVRPHVVRAVLRRGQRTQVKVDPLRRVMSPATAATLTTIMEGVVERGTAKTAQIDRYQVAGKTGTAHKVVDRRYSDSDFNASFVGFVPSRRPAFAILVVIDTPRAGSHFGGAVAAPVFKRIAEAALQAEGVPPSIDPMPAIIVASSASSPEHRTTGMAVIPASTASGGLQVMPDLRGLGAREAVRILGGLGLLVRVGGSGLVTTQTPAAGMPVEPGGWSSVVLGRDPARPDVRGPGGER